MKNLRMASIALLGLLAVGVGLVGLTTPVAAQGCEPVVCPAIALICPQGQLACRVSPCNCALACAAEGHGCNA